MKVWALGLGMMAGLAQGQRLPATAPTTVPTTAPSPASQTAAPVTLAPLAPVKAVAPQHKARVEFTGRMLAVTADNSSLNQILREVARLTGMKITGGVTDERVYGAYGPGDVSSVLAQLVGGTGSNMLLILDAKEMPAELILTPRQGGPSPPSPAMTTSAERGDDDDSDRPPQMKFGGPPRAAASGPERQFGMPPPAAVPAAAPVAAPAASATTEVSPNGVKTPQQIYDQLMQMQQAQKAPKQ